MCVGGGGQPAGLTMLLDTLACTLASLCALQHSEEIVQYSTVQHSTVQYSTVQYSTVQYSTIQYSTVQYSTIQYIHNIFTEQNLG